MELSKRPAFDAPPSKRKIPEICHPIANTKSTGDAPMLLFSFVLKYV